MAVPSSSSGIAHNMKKRESYTTATTTGAVATPKNDIDDDDNDGGGGSATGSEVLSQGALSLGDNIHNSIIDNVEDLSPPSSSSIPDQDGIGMQPQQQQQRHQQPQQQQRQQPNSWHGGKKAIRKMIPNIIDPPPFLKR